jgi:class 3 adenylate cyclase
VAIENARLFKHVEASLDLPLGDRLKMLRAIRELAVVSPVSPEAERKSQIVAARRDAAPVHVGAPAAEVSGERRYLTVMFCDLVGSTSISAQLDAEEWRDLVGTYLDAASAAVMEMGGHVAKKLGDGLMALFGYPVAQENDAERAARAALSIQRARRGEPQEYLCWQASAERTHWD